MADDPIIQAMETFTLIGVLIAFALFTRLALRSRSLGKFRFQLSIFILLWAVAELPHVGSTLGLVSTVDYESFGLGFHMVSMAAFAVFIGARSFKFLTVHPSGLNLTGGALTSKHQKGIRP